GSQTAAYNRKKKLGDWKTPECCDIVEYCLHSPAGSRNLSNGQLYGHGQSLLNSGGDLNLSIEKLESQVRHRRTFFTECLSDKVLDPGAADSKIQMIPFDKIVVFHRFYGSTGRSTTFEAASTLVRTHVPLPVCIIRNSGSCSAPSAGAIRHANI